MFGEIYHICSIEAVFCWPTVYLSTKLALNGPKTLYYFSFSSSQYCFQPCQPTFFFALVKTLFQLPHKYKIEYSRANDYAALTKFVFAKAAILASDFGVLTKTMLV